jgi:hypothetical protein
MRRFNPSGKPGAEKEAEKMKARNRSANQNE